MLLWVLNCACGAPARSIVKDDGRDGVLEIEPQRADVYMEGNVFCGGGFCLNDVSLDAEKKRGRLARTYEELIKFPYGASELMEFAAACKTWVATEVQELLAIANLDWATRERIASEIRHEVHATDDMFSPLFIVDASELLARLARDRLLLERADGGSSRWLRGRWRRVPAREKKSKMGTLRKPTVVPRGVRSSGDLRNYQHCERIRRLQRRNPKKTAAAKRRGAAKRGRSRTKKLAWRCRRTPVTAKEFTLRKPTVRKANGAGKPAVRKAIGAGKPPVRKAIGAGKPAVRKANGAGKAAALRTRKRCARCVKEKKHAGRCTHKPKPDELFHAISSDGVLLRPKSFLLQGERRKKKPLAKPPAVPVAHDSGENMPRNTGDAMELDAATGLFSPAAVE